ncbi:MAG: cobalamin biosynthesis protein [Alphaproteobacteria bacterium]|nr:cobalamin biosynthesis protein [Alphaproteobacteria bacterium]
MDNIFDTLKHWHNALIDTDRIPVILGAILLTAILGMIRGPFLGNIYPFIWQAFEKLLGRIGDKMDNPKRSPSALMFRGLLITIIALGLAFVIGQGVSLTALTTNIFVEIVLLSLLITSGTVWFALLRLYFAMDKKQLTPGAFYDIARSTRTDLNAGDDHGIVRRAMSLSVKSFDKGLIAPALWYLIGGFPAAIIYSALAVISWRHGREGSGSSLSAIPMALEKLMAFVPSLYAAALITLAATFTPTAKLHKGLASWINGKNRASYEQGGPALSALAWALNLSLGGPGVDLSGTPIKGAWVGPEGASAKVSHKDLRYTIYISVISHLLFIASLIGAYIWSGS